MIELIKRKKAVCVVKDNKNFYYVPFGSEIHGKISFKVWISFQYVKSEDSNYYIEFPVKGNLIRSEKGTLIVKPTNDNDNFVIFPIEVEAGYRGTSKFEIINSEETETFVLHFYNYRSPLGRLGVNDGGLIFTKKFPILIKVERTGRLYGGEANAIFQIDYKENEIIITEAPDDEIEKILLEK